MGCEAESGCAGVQERGRCLSATQRPHKPAVAVQPRSVYHVRLKKVTRVTQRLREEARRKGAPLCVKTPFYGVTKGYGASLCGTSISSRGVL